MVWIGSLGRRCQLGLGRVRLESVKNWPGLGVEMQSLEVLAK